MTGINPEALAKTLRGGRRLRVDDPRAEHEPDAIGNAATWSISAIVSAWLVGERARFDTQLHRAIEWLTDAEARDERFGGDPELFAMLRRRALGIGRWLADGGAARDAWHAAAKGGAARFDRAPEAPDAETVAEHVLDWLLAGEPASAVAAAKRFPDVAGSRDVATATMLAAYAAENRPPDRAWAVAVARLLGSHAEGWWRDGSFLSIAAWTRAIFFDTGLAADPEAALLMLYPHLRGAPLPPELRSRGWEQGEGPVVVPVPAALDRIDLLVEVSGLVRDPDRGKAPHGTMFASWSGAAGDRREVDYQAEDGDARIEVRGPDAGALAGSLAGGLGSRIAPAPEAALADLLTPPPGPPASATGAIRWETLRAAIAAAVPETAGLTRALVAAGLRDSDWRVRMTAVLGTGRLGLADLGEAAFAAPVPEAGTSGLGQEERRALLALRHAARNLALRLDPADSLPGEPGEILDARVAYQRRLRGLIETPVTEIGDPASRFVAILLGDPAAQAAPLPRWAGGRG